MNPSTIPTTCSLTLSAVMAAGLSHWWSVHQFSSLLEQGVRPAPMAHGAPADDQPKSPSNQLAEKKTQHADLQASLAANGTKSQREFYEALIEKMSQVETQNRDLLDQLAETNRDMMKLQFRVDMNSESFRPLPVSEAKPAIDIGKSNNTDSLPGVLPPRAQPVQLPTYE